LFSSFARKKRIRVDPEEEEDATAPPPPQAADKSALSPDDSSEESSEDEDSDEASSERPTAKDEGAEADEDDDDDEDDALIFAELQKIKKERELEKRIKVWISHLIVFRSYTNSFLLFEGRRTEKVGGAVTIFLFFSVYPLPWLHCSCPTIVCFYSRFYSPVLFVFCYYLVSFLFPFPHQMV
jgi:hypothetical protein